MGLHNPPFGKLPLLPAFLIVVPKQQKITSHSKLSEVEYVLKSKTV